MFETVPRRVTVYSLLDVVEGTVDLNAAAPRLTDFLGGGHDWLVLRDARVTPRGADRGVDLPLVRVNLARVECLVDEDDHVRDERFVSPRTPVRIDARFPSGLIVSGDISLPEGATWMTAVDVIDDDDRLKPLAGAQVIIDRRVVREGVTALVRLKAALYLHEETGTGVIARLVAEAAAERDAPAPGGR
jgi:hypothetical protein